MLFGIDPAAIPYTLSRVPAKKRDAASSTIKDPEARMKAHPIVAHEIDEMKGLDYFKWSESWWHFDSFFLALVFDDEELTRLYYDCPFLCGFMKDFETKHPLLEKIRLSLWHYGGCRDYNKFVEYLEAFKKLRVDLPDFEVRLTHSHTINTHGSAVHAPSYLCLDGSFGVLLFYKGEHVLTTSFGLAADGIYIAQFQLRQKKGNRWLYKLPKHYVDFMLDVLAEAFGQANLWLVEGHSAVDAVHRFYGVDKDGNSLCKLTAEDDARIAGVYNRPLTRFERGTETSHRNRRLHVKLYPKKDALQNAA